MILYVLYRIADGVGFEVLVGLFCACDVVVVYGFIQPPGVRFGYRKSGITQATSKMNTRQDKT